MPLSDAFDASVRTHPDKVALRFEGAARTYRDLGARVDKLAGGLAALGVHPGDHVVMISANHPACIECLLACAQVGAVYVPYNTRLSPSSIKQLLARSGAGVVVVSGDLYPAMRTPFAELGHPARVVVVGAPVPDADVLEYEQLVLESKPCAKNVHAAPSDTALVLYTSGTTGMPRGVLHSHDAFMKRIDSDRRTMRFDEDCVTLCVLPLFHVTFMSAIITLIVGGELVMAHSRKEDDLLTAIARFDVTHLCVVPFLLRLLASRIQREGMVVDSLRLVVYGGEPIDEELLSCCQGLFACEFLQGYGMTETLGAVTALLSEHHEDLSRLLTAGKPVPGAEVKIVDEHGAACQPGVTGEVAVRSDTLMQGYFRGEERTSQVICDGWYLTGDIGILDGQGFLTLVGRKSGMVITGGENVYPLEVERCIRSLGDDVADVAVVGVPDAYWGESIAALIVRRPGSALTEVEVVSHCARQLGGYKKPRRVVFVDKLERTASGKISKKYVDRLIAGAG